MWRVFAVRKSPESTEVSRPRRAFFNVAATRLLSLKNFLDTSVIWAMSGVLSIAAQPVHALVICGKLAHIFFHC